MPLMILSRYAAHRGVDRKAVTHAIESGRILIAKTTPRGKKQKTIWIDQSDADRRWLENTDPGALRQPTGPRCERPVDDGDADSVDPADYQKHRARREKFAAKNEEIDYKKSSGKLVEIDKCTAAAFNAAQTVKSNMLNIPDRISAMLAAEIDERKCHEMLTHELRVALQEISDGKIF